MKSVKKLESVKTQLFNNSELSIVKGGEYSSGTIFCNYYSLNSVVRIADNITIKK